MQGGLVLIEGRRAIGFDPRPNDNPCNLPATISASRTLIEADYQDSVATGLEQIGVEQRRDVRLKPLIGCGQTGGTSLADTAIGARGIRMHIIAQIWGNEVITSKPATGEVGCELAKRYDVTLLGSAVDNIAVVSEWIEELTVVAGSATHPTDRRQIFHVGAP